MATDNGSPHWSKDFVEHLRTVHFALVSVSAGLILLLASFHTYKPAQAVAELERIMDAQENWDFEKLVLAKTGFREDWRHDYALKGDALRHEKVNCHFNPLLAVGDQYSDSETKEYEAKPPVTLDEFEHWLHQHLEDRAYYAAHPPNMFGDAYSWVDEKSYGRIQVDKPYGDPSYSVDLSLQEANESLAKRLNCSDCYYFYVGKSFDGFFTFYLPAEPEKVVLNKTDFIAGVTKWCDSLQTCFPALSHAAVDLRTLKLSDVKAHLIQELEKGDVVFEAFGLKIPVNELTIAGFLLVLSIQLYFFLHLKELHEKAQPYDSGWDVAWVGLYASLPSRIVFFSTLWFLPCGAIVLLIFRAITVVGDDANLDLVSLSPLRLSLFIIGLISSLALSWVGWRYRPVSARRARRASADSLEAMPHANTQAKEAAAGATE